MVRGLACSLLEGCRGEQCCEYPILGGGASDWVGGSLSPPPPPHGGMPSVDQWVGVFFFEDLRFGTSFQRPILANYAAILISPPLLGPKKARVGWVGALVAPLPTLGRGRPLGGWVGSENGWVGSPPPPSLAKKALVGSFCSYIVGFIG